MVVTFFAGRGDRRPELFVPSSLYVSSQMPWISLQIIVLQYRRSMLSNFLVFHTWVGYFMKTCSFPVFNFSSSSCVNCPSFISSYLLLIFVIGLGSSVSFGDFPS